MLIKRIEGMTRALGAPPDWDEKRDGICDTLPIRDEEQLGGSNRMVSAWEPTPDELERLKAGAPVYLSVVGGAHPPVMLTVGEAPA